MNRFGVKRTIFTGGMALLSAGLLYSQSQTQSIQGLITDSTGAVISGAKVAYTNEGTGVTATAQTNDTGNYGFQLVPVGNYEVKVEMQGFKSELVKGLRVETAAQVRQDFKLQVGNVAESIEVSAAGVTLQTENAVVGGVIENKRIIELPLNGRNVAQLAVLVPGVQFGDRTGRGDGLGGFPISGQGFSVSANGQREIHQVVSLDGVDAKDPRIHITNFVPSIEAIEEFKIETNAYSASVGFGGGAVVSITMKSGTNAIHGTLFEFVRNDKLDAEDYFLNFQLAPGVARRKKNTLRRNQFGLVVSGPLIKNKTFWAFNWESRRERIGVVQEGAFPLDEFREGNFGALLAGTVNPATGRLFRPPIVIYDPVNGLPFSGNIIPRNRQNAGVVGNILPKYLPRPQFRPADPLDVNYRASIVSPINTNTYFGRVDHYFSDANRVFGRIALDRSGATNNNLNPEFPSINDNKVENLATQWVHTFNPNMINELRFGFNRSFGGTRRPRQNTTFDVDSLGIGQFRVFNDGNRKFTPLENGLPNLGFGIGDGGEFNQLDSYQMGSHLSWNKGKHNLKFGGEYYFVHIERAAANVPNGQAIFSSLQTGYDFASFLMGYPNQTRTAEGWPYTFPVAGRQGYYVNDDWKVSSKLTVNLGFRFDYNGNSRDTKGLQRVLDFPGGTQYSNGRGAGYKTSDGRTIPIMFPNQADATGGIKLWKQDVRFFMPRIGIAYRPMDKWVIRTGVGWFDNINHMNTWTILNLNPPKSGVFDFFSQTEAAPSVPITGADNAAYNVATRRFIAGTPVLSLADPFLQNSGAAATRTGAQSITTVPPDTKDGAVWKWSFDIQRELPHQLAVTVGYVGSKGTHVGNSIGNYNSPQPSSNTNVNVRRPFTQFFDPALPQFGVQTLGAVRYLDSYGESFHHGLQVKVDKRYSKGLSMGIAYTFSKSHGDGENGGQEGASFQNPRDRVGSRGLYRFDQRHNFVGHYVWELPGQHMAGPLKHIIGGWQSNGILSMRTGFPFNVGQGDDLNTGSPIRPDRIKDGRLDNPTRQLWFDPTAFQRVTCNNPNRTDLCHYGSNGYNTLRSPGQFNLDFSLYKNFKVKERYQIQYRWELFNSTNTPYFSDPIGVGFATINSVAPDASRMGEVRSLRIPMRRMQMGLKFFF